MTESLTLPAVPDATMLVALSPAEMPAAQSALRDWLQRKLESVRGELWEVWQNIVIARAAKWKSSAWESQAKRTGKRIIFYEKVLAAVEAGFLIVPDFPIDVFAIRVKGWYARGSAKRHNWQSEFVQRPQELPAGEGRYASPDPTSRTVNHWEKDPKTGEQKCVDWYKPYEFTEVEFPIQTASPVVLDATRRAMALNIFDQLGTVGPARQRDPIVVGQVVLREGYKTRTVTFFVAWWLNPETL